MQIEFSLPSGVDDCVEYPVSRMPLLIVEYHVSFFTSFFARSSFAFTRTNALTFLDLPLTNLLKRILYDLVYSVFVFNLSLIELSCELELALDTDSITLKKL